MPGKAHKPLHAGDRITVKTGSLAGQKGVIEECQPACVYRVRLVDGRVCYYSVLQLTAVVEDALVSPVRKIISQAEQSRN
jgi:ribosomal protein L24